MNASDGSMILPDLKQYSDQPVFNTKAVVQQTGVPAPTLRAWERRYALLVPERADNTYRLYSERHVALIRWLKERVDSGISISQAAALFRHLEQQRQPEMPGQHRAMAATEIYFELPADSSPAFEIGLNAPDASLAQFDEAKENSFTPNLVLPTSPLSYSHDQPENDYPAGYTMQMARAQIIEIFQDMDEQAAQVLMGAMLSLYSVEQVCCELIIPTLWKIGDLWTEGKLTVSVEHFASNFFRAMLTNLFHLTRRSTAGPSIITCCAPGEPHELSILMLSLFLRRSGMHVVYLGQSIETASLMHTIKKLSPAAICISVTLPAYMPALASLGRQIRTLTDVSPLLFFGGQAFCSFSQPEKLIPEGIYMDGDLQEITVQLQSLVRNHLVKQHAK
jgi:DNA-binding transcriptional MerR regulator